jgi:hypothetical protein
MKKNIITEQSKYRFAKLSGLNEDKKFFNKILLENMNFDNFDIVKFENDGFGKKNTDEEVSLYKMMEKDEKY